MKDKTIQFKRGWIKELKYCWMEEKIRNMDLSGMSMSSYRKLSKEHNKDIGFETIAIRGLVQDENGSFHIVANTYYDKDLSDGAWETTNNFNKLVKAIKNDMKERKEMFIEIGHETWNLEERDTDLIIKIEKSQNPTQAKS